MGARKALGAVLSEFAGFAVALVVVALLWTYVVPHHRPAPKSQPVQAADAGAAIPDLKGYEYQPGLAAEFAGLDPSAACSRWNKLPEPERYGLAFVAAGAVPACADSRYAAAAAKARADRLHKGYLWEGHTEYFDLGTPAFASYYDPSYSNSERYSCAYLTKLVSTNYVTDPMPKPKDPYVETAADQKAFNKWEDEVQGVNQIFAIYSQGGKFDPGCYPPGVRFGKDNSVTFYPNAPVKNLAETPAPVFTGNSRCNICFRGPVYRVKKGDTLEKISTCFYGESWEQFDIQANNNLSDHDLRFLQIGQKLHLPDKKKLGHCVKPLG